MDTLKRILEKIGFPFEYLEQNKKVLVQSANAAAARELEVKSITDKILMD